MAQDNLESQSEQEIQFKKRARRRLVGAIALVLLMIVILPMLLEDRVAQPPKEDIVISIPSQDNQLDSKPETTPNKVADVAQTVGPQTTPVATTSLPVSDSDVKVPEVKSLEPSVPVVQSEKVVVKPADAASASAQELKPVRKEQDKPKLDKPPVTANFFVQIGVFSDTDNVKQMQSKLTDKGLKSRADLIDTTKGKKTRLRVGAFSSKNDAEAALEKIKSLGLTGMVVGN